MKYNFKIRVIKKKKAIWEQKVIGGGKCVISIGKPL